MTRMSSGAYDGRAAEPPYECADCSQLLAERDEASEAADELVNVIERYFGVECGEHSNLNCPWQEALSFMEAEIKRRDAA